jgi:hypothetical protein
MGKHVAGPNDRVDGRIALDRQSQEREGRDHAWFCRPKHASWSWHPAERDAQVNYTMAAEARRQSKFYETHDRTEDARPNDDWEFFDGYYSDGDKEED